MGVLANEENRLFGEYVCSLTKNLGGRDVKTKALLYFPTIPQTRLQYIDLYKPPLIALDETNFCGDIEDKIRFCGHVGKDKNGYHVVFVA